MSADFEPKRCFIQDKNGIMWSPPDTQESRKKMCMDSFLCRESYTCTRVGWYWWEIEKKWTCYGSGPFLTHPAGHRDQTAQRRGRGSPANTARGNAVSQSDIWSIHFDRRLKLRRPSADRRAHSLAHFQVNQSLRSLKTHFQEKRTKKKKEKEGGGNRSF